MRHARPDYNRLQDPAKLIPENEPVFLLRGQDPKTQACMRKWIELAKEDGSDPKLIAMVEGWIPEINKWQTQVKVKPSDLPTEPPPDTAIEPKIGQVWEDVSQRGRGAKYKIINVVAGQVICEQLCGPHGSRIMGTRQKKLMAHLFHPTVKLYKLVPQ